MQDRNSYAKSIDKTAPEKNFDDYCPDCGCALRYSEASFYCPVCGFSQENLLFDL
ncbi:MAG: hypothetical protein PHS44_07910 [Candidatus Dojkabacteria bacterium]|nr:hypothetical protein [Candidatus Dojkabacteria bacterium]